MLNLVIILREQGIGNAWRLKWNFAVLLEIASSINQIGSRLNTHSNCGGREL